MTQDMTLSLRLSSTTVDALHRFRQDQTAQQGGEFSTSTITRYILDRFLFEQQYLAEAPVLNPRKRSYPDLAAENRSLRALLAKLQAKPSPDTPLVANVPEAAPQLTTVPFWE